MRKIIFALTVLLMLALSMVAYCEAFYSDMQENIVRLHIMAKSNSDEDQAIKLAVRDEILNSTRDIDINDTSQFVKVAQDTANQYLINHNIPYRAAAESGIFRFPQKTYGNITLPAGEYKGIRIILDKGKGKNWWCVMCPPICTADSDTAMNTLKNNITHESYTVITQKPKFRFLLLNWLNK